MKPLRIGVIGCGRIAQVMHLPFLSELPQYSLVGLADLSPAILAALAERYPTAETHLDWRELISRKDVDAVAVSTPDHAAIVEAAALAGKHVFVEKPLCFTPAEAAGIADAVAATGVRLMVGYMRRFDPAVHELARQLSSLGEPRVVRAHDSLGLRSVPLDIYSLNLAPDGVLPDDDRSARLRDAIGSDDPILQELYWIVLMLGVHDLSVLRALLGPPSGVATVDTLGERQLIATLEYASGAHAILELAVWPEHTWSVSEVTVATDVALASLSFANPWVRYLPTALTIRRASDGTTLETVGPTSYREPFREEWLEFYDAVTGGRNPLTDVGQGAEDVGLAVEIIRAIPAKAAA